MSGDFFEKTPFHIVTDDAPDFHEGEFYHKKKQLALAHEVHEHDIRFGGQDSRYAFIELRRFRTAQ
jgi:hypothetical protein